MNDQTFERANNIKMALKTIENCLIGAEKGSRITFQVSPSQTCSISDSTLGDELMQVLRNSAIDVLTQRQQELLAEYDKL